MKTVLLFCLIAFSTVFANLSLPHTIKARQSLFYWDWHPRITQDDPTAERAKAVEGYNDRPFDFKDVAKITIRSGPGCIKIGDDLPCFEPNEGGDYIFREAVVYSLIAVWSKKPYKIEPIGDQYHFEAFDLPSGNKQEIPVPDYDGSIYLFLAFNDGKLDDNVGRYKVYVKILEWRCDQDGTYRTQSEGDWGDSCDEGFDSGCFRDRYFDKCFPNGLWVGCHFGKFLYFSDSEYIEGYLPQLGNPASLQNNYYNPVNDGDPISTESGVFGGQVTALALSLGFDRCEEIGIKFKDNCGSLADLYLCDECNKRTNNNCQRTNNNDANCDAFQGWTVKQVYHTARRALGGCCDGGGPERTTDNTCNVEELNKCVKFINQAFIFGKRLDQVRGFSEYPCVY